MSELSPLFVFKLKQNIVMDSEVLLARRELESLLGDTIGEIKNLTDLFVGNEYPQIQLFLKYRVQDKITRCTYLGAPQAFLYPCDAGEQAIDTRKLQRRLAYCKEIYVFSGKSDLKKTLSEEGIRKIQNAEDGQEMFLDDLTTCITDSSWVMLRFFTHSFLLELIHYMPILCNRRGGIDDNIKIMDRLKTKLLKHLHQSEFVQPYGGFLRDIEDYADLYINYKTYLTHSIHKFKGRAFHRMTRALINITAPENDDSVLDPFSGSGTTPLEGILLGLNAAGTDIVEFFNKIARAKTRLVTWDRYDFEQILQCMDTCKKSDAAQGLDQYINSVEVKEFGDILASFNNTINKKKRLVSFDVKDFAWAVSIVRGLPQKDKQEVIEVLLSQTLESVSKRGKIDKSKLIERAKLTLINLYLELHIARSLSIIPKKIRLPEIWLIDTTKRTSLPEESIDAIVTSPPYVNALDYLEMHKTSIALIGGLNEFSSLNEKIIGYPAPRKEQKIDASKLPKLCEEILEDVISKTSEENKFTIGLYNYMCDLQGNLEEMHRLMKKGGKAAYIVGKEGYWRVNGKLITVRGAVFIKELIEQCFKVVDIFDIDLLKRRPYAKAVMDETVERSVDETTLATETVIIFEKI